MATEQLDASKTNASITVEDRNVKTYQLSPEILDTMKESVLIYLRSHPEFIKELINEAFTSSSEEVQLKTMPKDLAKNMIHDFINRKPGCKTSEIIMTLELEPQLVMEILKELKEEEAILSKSIEQ